MTRIEYANIVIESDGELQAHTDAGTSAVWLFENEDGHQAVVAVSTTEVSTLTDGRIKVSVEITGPGRFRNVVQRAIGNTKQMVKVDDTSRVRNITQISK